MYTPKSQECLCPKALTAVEGHDVCKIQEKLNKALGLLGESGHKSIPAQKDT